MTCQELRLFFEDPLPPDAEFRVESEHLANCSECARFVDTQRQLRSGLRRLRDAVPQFPEKLDAAVLTNYRRDVANRPSNVNAAAARRRIAILGLSGAAAAIVLMAVLPFLVRPSGTSQVSREHRPASTAVSQSIAGNPTAKLSVPAEIGSSHRARHRHSAAPVVAREISPSPDFRSLMYCDELSCGGVMELIRVQLPSGGVVPGSASTAAGGTVIADVLVGPDGIARGIRIVE